MNAKKNLEEMSNDEISRLFKMMLIMVEDMKKDHDFHYEKLYKNIPKKYHPVIDTADHFTNLCSRIDNYQVSFVFK